MLARANNFWIVIELFYAKHIFLSVFYCYFSTLDKVARRKVSPPFEDKES